MDVEIERRSKPLDQRDSAGAGRLAGKPGLPDQVGKRAWASARSSAITSHSATTRTTSSPCSSPSARSRVFIDPKTLEATPVPVDETLPDEAIAYYQTASGAFKYRKLLAPGY
jgi:hypothetical protein